MEGINISTFLVRNILRRPVFVLALLLIVVIASGRYPGCSGSYENRYSQADGRRFTVSGIVTAKELTANGYHIILDHLSFADGSSSAYAGRSADESTPDGSVSSEIFPDGASSEDFPGGASSGGGIGRQLAQGLNIAVLPGDRLQVFLSDGDSGGDSLYGADESGEPESSGWMRTGYSEDQTELFQSVRIGDRISLYGKCMLPEKATNPGQFDSRRWCLARRIVLKMSVPQLRGIAQPEENLLQRIAMFYRRFVSDMRIGMQTGLLSVFGPEDAPQIAAFVLGDGSGLNSSEKKLFRDGGLSWLVCVSSLHISLLGMIVYRLLRSRGSSFLLSSLLTSVIAVSYALMTGFSISAKRALVTFIVWMGAQVFGRTRDTLTSLSAAVIVILIRQPYALWDSSLVISCVCIMSLEYLSPAAERIFRPRLSYQRKMCRTISLWAGSFPAVLWFFYQTTPYASLLYPVMLPLMSLFMAFGILGSAAGYMSLATGMSCFTGFGRIMAVPCSVMLKGLRLLCRLETSVPGSVLILGRPAVWQMITYYGALAVSAFAISNSMLFTERKRTPAFFHVLRMPDIRKHRRLASRVLTAAGLIVLAVTVSIRRRPYFRYVCMDIGQGSCNLIEHRGHAYLFDAGSGSVQNVWRYRIESTLKYYGIRDVDAVFLSHADLDHIDGIQQMLDSYHVNMAGRNSGGITLGRVILPSLIQGDERFVPVISGAVKNSIPVGYAGEGDCLSQDGMTLEILNPSPDRMTGDANQDCMVMLLRLMNLSILFTGDLEKDGEKLFVSRWEHSRLFEEEMEEGTGSNRRRSDGGVSGGKHIVILIAGHHGSKNATSDELLRMLMPDLALISCGHNNRYGHPAGEMLERLKSAGVPYRRTDMEGAVIIDF